jgi:hypothetical protein
MIRIVLGGVLVLAVGLVGCKKPKKPTQPDSEPPKYVSSGGGAAAPNQNGNLTVTGGQGAIQSPRMAIAREVNEAQMRDLHLSMSQSFLLDNRLPTSDEIMKQSRQNSQLSPLLKEEVIILTGATRGDQVWAYSRYPQRAGNHFVITQQGVEHLSPDDLRKRLEAQGAPIKMAK